MQKGSFGFNCI